MTTTPDELPPLPVDGPTSRELVKIRLHIDDASDDTDLDVIAPAVNLVVRRLPIADRARGAESWPADIVLGATMLAGRLLRRKNSPDGVVAFGDLGPVYVQRNDPDIAMMLGLGDWASPAVG